MEHKYSKKEIKMIKKALYFIILGIGSMALTTIRTIHGEPNLEFLNALNTTVFIQYWQGTQLPSSIDLKKVSPSDKIQATIDPTKSTSFFISVGEEHPPCPKDCAFKVYTFHAPGKSIYVQYKKDEKGFKFGPQSSSKANNVSEKDMIVIWQDFTPLLTPLEIYKKINPSLSSKSSPNEILGVGKNPTPEEIKKAYTARMLEWDPVKNPDYLAYQVSKLIEWAYRTLMGIKLEQTGGLSAKPISFKN